MKSIQRPAALRYGFAVLATGMMIVLHVLATWYAGPISPFEIYVPAVAAAAWFGGYRPALLSGLLATLVGGAYLVALLHLDPWTVGALLRLLVFWGSSLFVIHIIV